MKILNVVIVFCCSIFNQENKYSLYDKYFQKELDQVLVNTDKNFPTNKIYYLRGSKLSEEKYDDYNAENDSINTEKNINFEDVEKELGDIINKVKNNNVYSDDDQLAFFIKNQNKNSEK